MLAGEPLQSVVGDCLDLGSQKAFINSSWACPVTRDGLDICLRSLPALEVLLPEDEVAHKN